MKKHLIIATVIVTGLLVFSQTASAGNLKKRLHRQDHRIQQGIHSGEITPREARKLDRDQRQVRQLRRHYLSDGHLSMRERIILNSRLDQSSKHIYRYKHNQRHVPKTPYYRDFFGFFAWH